jgi:general secretion pathway protein D
MMSMITKSFQLCRLALALGLCCCGTAEIQAQTRPTTGTGAGAGTGGSSFRPSGSSGGGSGSTGNYDSATSIGSGTVSVDPETGRVFFVGDAKAGANFTNIMAHLDRPKPQVLIKVVFVEIQHDDDLDIGFDASFNKNSNPGVFGTGTNAGISLLNQLGASQLGAQGQQIGQSTMPFGQGLYSVTGQDYTATLRAIASKGKLEVLSRPSILVRNNQPATITVGQSVPLITGVTVNGLTGSPISTISYQNVGIILQVTPFIKEDGLVEMILAPQISSLSSQSVQVSSNVFAPVIDLRSANTVVVTPDNQTVIIGGLIENDKTEIESKVPLLGDIPWVGNLFKHKQKAVSKKELMIFLTPRVMGSPAMLAASTISETERMEMSRRAFSADELNKFFDTLPLTPFDPIGKKNKKSK